MHRLSIPRSLAWAETIQLSTFGHIHWPDRTILVREIPSVFLATAELLQLAC